VTRLHVTCLNKKRSIQVACDISLKFQWLLLVCEVKVEVPTNTWKYNLFLSSHTLYHISSHLNVQAVRFHSSNSRISRIAGIVFVWRMVRMWLAVAVVLLFVGGFVEGKPHRILVDTDVDTDDFFALLYLLKLNTSQFKLEVYPSIKSMQHFLFLLLIFFFLHHSFWRSFICYFLT